MSILVLPLNTTFSSPITKTLFQNRYKTIAEKIDLRISLSIFQRPGKYTKLLPYMTKAILSVSLFLLFINPLKAQFQCFTGDCFDGYGECIFPSGARYAGEFSHGLIHGHGVLTFSNGDKYSGQWRFHLRDGQGIYNYSDGRVYRGQFERNHFHGHGVLSYPNGTWFEGLWANHQPHGPGILYMSDGQIIQGIWDNGALMTPDPSEDKAPVSSLEETPDSTNEVRIWAVVVGVAQYQHMKSLRFTDDDAYQLYAFLKSPQGGALPDEQIQVLIDDYATRENILRAMDEVLLQSDENDVMLFYFSGHGLEDSFLPADYDGEHQRLYYSEIEEILHLGKARHKIVLADACHAGAFTPDFAAKSPNIQTSLRDFYQAFEDAEGGIALLLSSKGEEFSLEDGGLRSGVFSHYLIRGLKGAADDNDNGIVTIQELYEYVGVKVREYTAGAQSPVLKGKYDSEMPVGIAR